MPQASRLTDRLIGFPIPEAHLKKSNMRCRCMGL